MEKASDFSQARGSGSQIPIFKVVIVGDQNVGKTCLIKRYIDGTFADGEDATLGAQFYSMKMKGEYQAKQSKGQDDDSKSQSSSKKSEISGMDKGVTGGEIIKGDVKLQLWDTAGEERFRSLTPLYYKDAQAILVAFSLLSAESFDNLEKWMKEIDQNIATANFVLVVVGTKSDCDDQKEVPVKEGSKFAKQYGALYWETSAATGENVNKMFQEIANRLYKISQTKGFEAKAKGEKITSGKSKKKKKKGSGCC